MMEPRWEVTKPSFWVSLVVTFAIVVFLVVLLCGCSSPTRTIIRAPMPAWPIVPEPAMVEGVAGALIFGAATIDPKTEAGAELFKTFDGRMVLIISASEYEAAWMGLILHIKNLESQPVWGP